MALPKENRDEDSWRARLSFRLLGYIRGLILIGLSSTWRKQFIRLEVLDASLSEDKPYIIVFWHAKYLALIPLFRGRKACIFTSKSNRGNAIADLLLRFGFVPVQLLDHGGDDSLEQMRKALSNGLSAGIAVDGPLGPYHQVHRGALELSSKLGYPILPISFAASPKHVLLQRWDRLEIPSLFARVALVVGSPIEIPEKLSASDLEFWLGRVRDAMEFTDRQAADNLDRR